jgi:hypothetical protein
MRRTELATNNNIYNVLTHLAKTMWDKHYIVLINHANRAQTDKINFNETHKVACGRK